MKQSNSTLDTSIEFLKGVGPARARLLKDELGITKFSDLLFHFPFRYVDKSKISLVSAIASVETSVQLKGTLSQIREQGSGRGKRLSARFSDSSGSIDLVWFRGVGWLSKSLKTDVTYLLFAKPSAYKGKFNIAHPELEVFDPNSKVTGGYTPVYPTTEKLRSRGLDSRGLQRLTKGLFDKLNARMFTENLPDAIRKKYRFPNRFDAIRNAHFPSDQEALKFSRDRLKFEELFFYRLRLLRLKSERKVQRKGYVFEHVGAHFNKYFETAIPFELTGAQKRVLKEIRKDLKVGSQMNRLLQGDVGSGKTIVAILTMLLAADNGFQACLMAPTEILARQHYSSIAPALANLGLKCGFLSGAVKGKKRAQLLKELNAGEIHVLIGTHALIEDPVKFQNLGVVIIDEQHRFGVEQRSKLWAKSKPLMPHVLVMTATPIPRTLSMTLYGDLDVSVIDELPPGRKPIQTVHRYENKRDNIVEFLKFEISKGRQVYIVYPLIQESDKLDLKNLMEGFDAVSRDFPIEDGYHLSIVHGQMKSDVKDYEVQRFVRGETQIMVATSVIEVGVNIPNASVMIIENANRFGLAQLHQLRGRVGRGGDQSYCILMTEFELSKEAKVRLKTMVETNDGFKISEVDMQLRGPGNIQGTQQSGLPDLHLADLVADEAILMEANLAATKVLTEDPELKKPDHMATRNYLEHVLRNVKGWAMIS